MMLRLVPISCFALTTVLAFAACNPAIIANGTGATGGSGSTGNSTSTGMGGGQGGACNYMGKQYAVTAMWPAEGDCGTCECDPGGWLCSSVLCTPDSGPGGGPSGGCVYDGMTYSAGQSFPAGDGCNTCTCASDGSVTCSTLACCYPDAGVSAADAGGWVGDGGGTCFYNCSVYAAGETFSAGDGCNVCTCESGGNVSCTTIACGCFYDGTLYGVGQSFPAADGCNTCDCLSTGVVECTSLPCEIDGGTPPPPLDGGPGCFYDGYEWAVGESFPAGDGCNTCTCEKSGNVACTTLACPLDGGGPPPSDGGPVLCFYDGQTYYPGEEFPAFDGCNTCACTDQGTVLCTTYTCDAGTTILDGGPIPF